MHVCPVLPSSSSAAVPSHLRSIFFLEISFPRVLLIAILLCSLAVSTVVLVRQWCHLFSAIVQVCSICLPRDAVHKCDVCFV